MLYKYLKAIHVRSVRSSSRLTASFWPLYPTTRLLDYRTLKQRKKEGGVVPYNFGKAVQDRDERTEVED